MERGAYTAERPHDRNDVTDECPLVTDQLRRFIMRVAHVKRRSARTVFVVAAAISVVVAAFVAAPAQADPLGDFTRVPVTKSRANGPVFGVTAGPDGSMWYTRYWSDKIGRIAPNGLTREFSLPSDVPSTPGNGAGLFEMAAGPDGNMWFTAFFDNFIGKITPAGVITTYPIPTPNSHPYGIAAGPDGNLWFTEDFTNAIGRITPEGVITEFAIPDVGSTGPATITEPADCIVCGYLITSGPDGAMWFTMPGASRIGRITVDGAITSFPVPTKAPASSISNPISVGDITAGADGNLWFTEPNDNQIGRMTTTGEITEFDIPTPASGSVFITPGPGGSLWFSEYDVSRMGRITLAGAITEYETPTASSEPGLGAAGADGDIWFSEQPLLAAPSGSTYPGRIATVGTGIGPVLTSKVSGSGAADSPLTCSYRNTTGWKVASVRYQWLRNGSPISGATKQAHTPTALSSGSSMRCRVSVTFTPALTQLGSISAGVRVAR